MDEADEAYVYFNPHTVEHKKLEPITPEMVFEGFATPGLRVTTDAKALFAELEAKNWTNSNLLLMSSGNFDGKDLPGIARRIADQ
jgi:UDP-N-acetylmuramate: L-alanyl-gamma-D-glutamyl-meso-diaminopimelate ligase